MKNTGVPPRKILIVICALLLISFSFIELKIIPCVQTRLHAEDAAPSFLLSVFSEISNFMGSKLVCLGVVALFFIIRPWTKPENHAKINVLFLSVLCLTFLFLNLLVCGVVFLGF